MEDKATPRPWRYHQFEDLTIMAGKPGICIALCDASSRPRLENEANARLIVRAVNSHDKLVEACRASREAFNRLSRISTESSMKEQMEGWKKTNKAIDLLNKVLWEA